MKKIKNPVTVLDHLTNRMIDDHNMKEKDQPKDESKEDEFIELDVPIKTPLWEDDESKEVKEGGEWYIGESSQNKVNGIWRCPIFTDAIFKKEQIGSGIGHTKEESELHAIIQSQSKNMYYALKELDNAAMLFADEHNTASALKIGQMLADLHNAHMNAKEILLKATSKK